MKKLLMLSLILLLVGMVHGVTAEDPSVLPRGVQPAFSIVDSTQSQSRITPVSSSSRTLEAAPGGMLIDETLHIGSTQDKNILISKKVNGVYPKENQETLTVAQIQAMGITSTNPHAIASEFIRKNIQYEEELSFTVSQSVDGYRQNYNPDFSNPDVLVWKPAPSLEGEANQLENPPVIHQFLETRNRIYEKTTDGENSYVYKGQDQDGREVSRVIDTKGEIIPIIDTSLNQKLILGSLISKESFSYTNTNGVLLVGGIPITVKTAIVETVIPATGANPDSITIKTTESYTTKKLNDDTNQIISVSDKNEITIIDIDATIDNDKVSNILGSNIEDWKEETFYGTKTAADGSQTIYSKVDDRIYKKEYGPSGNIKSFEGIVEGEMVKMEVTGRTISLEKNGLSVGRYEVKRGKVQCPKQGACGEFEEVLKDITPQVIQSSRIEKQQESRKSYQENKAESFGVFGGESTKGFTAYDLDLMVQSAQDFSAFSEIFVSDDFREDWRQTVDDLFPFDPATAVDKICEAKIDQPSQQVAFVELPSRDIGIGATANVKCSRTQEPITGEVLNLYAITAYVNAPISIDSDYKLRFNIFLENSSGKTYLYNETQALSRGNRLALTGDQTIVEYSTIEYEQICIEFEEPPRIIKTDLLCNKVVCTDAPIFEQSPGLTMGTAGEGDFSGAPAGQFVNEQTDVKVSCAKKQLEEQIEYTYLVQPNVILEDDSSLRIFLNGETELNVSANEQSTQVSTQYYSQSCVQIDGGAPQCQTIQC